MAKAWLIASGKGGVGKSMAVSYTHLAGPWVTEVRGSRSNVIGLPWELTRKLLLAAGVEVPVTKEQDGMMKHGADST